MSKVFSAAKSAVSSVVKAVGSVATSVVNAVGGVVSGVLNFVMSPFLGLFGMNMPSIDSGSQSIQGVTVQRTGTAVNIPVLYGYRQVGGAVTFAETGSDSNKYMWVAYVFSEGPVEGLHDLFIDDVQIPAANIAVLNTGAMTTITDTTCKYAGAMSLQWFSGYFDANPADTNVGNAIANGIFAGSPSWKRNMHYNGMAVLFARYEWKTTTSGNTQSAIYSGSIPVVKANILGRRVTSLIAGTPETIGYNDYAHGYTERYSTNPAEILLDYLRNPWYGKGMSNDKIDFDSFKRAAVKCNTEVTYTTSGIKGPILTLNYAVNTGNSIFANVKDILANFRAYLPYMNGRLSLVIEDAGNPTDILSGSTPIVATFNKDNIQGNIVYTGIDLSAKYNIVTVNYCDPDQQWTSQTVVYPPTETERMNYLTIDGFKENKGDFTFNGITNYAIAYDLARLIFNKSRQQDTLSLTVSSQAFELQPGDSIYVDGNVLGFGTDPAAGAIPWRIISTKLNNDYTFSLGCVRNPSSIYPYVRTADKAYNLAVYIPQGATRYYPPEPGSVPVGLNPPSNATLPAGGSIVTGGTGTDYPVTLPPTSPTGSAGGGVGSSTGTVNSTTNTNTAPTPATPAPVLNETITLKQADYGTVNGLVYATLTFVQPQNAAYSGVTVYWKRQIASETVYSSIADTTKPGAGQTFQVKIGPLVTQSYMVQTRVHYGTQGDSTQVGYESITPTSSGTETPVNYAQTISTGWTLNTTPIPNAADTIINTITGTTITSGGHPTTPRGMSFSIQQATTPSGFNTWVNGMQVFYRASTATYWNEFDVKTPANYVPGVTALTFNISDFGIPSYPNPPTAQSYDFVFRYTYSDGKAAVKQVRAMGIRMETNTIGSYDYDAFYGVNGTVETVGSYTVTTVNQAPPGAVSNPADMTIGLTNVQTYTQGANNVRFFFNPPDVSNQPNWYGVRVYYRAIVAGTNPAFTSVDITPATNAGGVWSALVGNITYDQPYQWIVVPLVTSSGGMITATNCWSGSGSVNLRLTSADYPSDSNFMTLLKFTTMKTSDALAQLSTSFPLTDPVAKVLTWKRNYVKQSDAMYTSWYYQLQVQVPTTGFNELRIYRRQNQKITNNTNYTYAFGTGRWELITVTTGFDSNGIQTFNLRGPIGSTEFDSYYNITSTSPFYPTYKSTTVINTHYTDASLTKPIAGTANHEFLLVVKTGGVVSNYGMLLPDIPYEALTASTNGLLVNLPARVTVADYNTYTAGYQRNLTDARSSIATSWLASGFKPDQSPLPTATPGVI